MQSGFFHKIKADFEGDSYELVETLDLSSTLAPDGSTVPEALGTDTARPICHEYTEKGRFA